MRTPGKDIISDSKVHSNGIRQSVNEMHLLKIGVVLQKPDKQFAHRLLVTRIGWL